MLLKTQSLTPIVLSVVKNKGTEPPYSGEYDDFGESGTYLCRQCGLALFRSQSKFHSGCGWPSFDETIPYALEHKKDADGLRTEILCSRCQAHLGHVFFGEKFTEKNARYCINSLSLDFVNDLSVNDTEEALFAAGCFWGVEYYFLKLNGVLKVESGYIGGNKENPSYEQICQGTTGHYEAVRVVYDKTKITYQDLVKYFFEIHDPSQVDGQGPDLGQQYLSAIFFYNDLQKNICLSLINELTQMGYSLATKLLPVTAFWKAESYHQNYYARMGKQPYCHKYQKRW